MRPSKKANPFFTVLVGLSLFPAIAGAWWGEGHHISSVLAYDLVTPKTRSALAHILAADPSLLCISEEDRFIEAAGWPDRLRSNPLLPIHVFAPYGIHLAVQTFILHFDAPENIALKFRPLYPSPIYAIGAIRRCEEVLKDANSSQEARCEALKFLIHIVEDLHQPLHCGRPEDKNGISIPIDTFLGRIFSTPQNLHTIWDASILEASNITTEQYVIKLHDLLKSPNAKNWRNQLSLESWVVESHQLAIRFAYTLPDGSPVLPHAHLDQAYYDAASPIVDRQLAKAGVHLAALLDSIFDSPAQ